MQKTSKCGFFLLLTLMVLLAAHDGFASTDSPERLVSPDLLEKVDLKISWEQQLPIQKGEILKRLYILDNRIYAVSDKNYVVSMNRENGTRVFARNFLPGSMPTEGLQLFDNKLVSVSGSRIIQVDPSSGLERPFIDLGFGIVAPVAANKDLMYISGIDKRLHIYAIDNKVQVFEVAADNESKITSVIAGEDIVVFGTDKGNVIGMTTKRSPKRYWQFNAAGPIVGPIVRDGRTLYFACGDTNVYRIDMIVGLEEIRLAWKYQANGILNAQPQVTQNAVYLYVPTKGVTAIDKGGSFLWSVPGGLNLLAESKGRAYVITKDENLVIMDNINAKKLYSINCMGVTKYAVNTEDSKIYIATKSGRLACLQPIQ